MRMYGRMRWNASGVGLIFCFFYFCFYVCFTMYFGEHRGKGGGMEL
jgi:hypothetical protein